MHGYFGTLVCAGYMYTLLSKMTSNCKLQTGPALAQTQDKENKSFDYFSWVILVSCKFRLERWETWDWALCQVLDHAIMEQICGGFGVPSRPRPDLFALQFSNQP